MNRDALVGLGLIGFGFMGIGILIGGYIMDKHHSKQTSTGIDIYKSVTNVLKETLMHEMEKNNKLKEELKSLKEA